MGPVEGFYLSIAGIVVLIGLARGYKKELGNTLVFIGAVLIYAALYEVAWDQVITVSGAVLSTENADIFLCAAFSVVFVAIVFASYAGRTLDFDGKPAAAPGGFFITLAVASVNGYLVAGTLWFFQAIFNYPIRLVFDWFVPRVPECQAGGLVRQRLDRLNGLCSGLYRQWPADDVAAGPLSQRDLLGDSAGHHDHTESAWVADVRGARTGTDLGRSWQTRLASGDPELHVHLIGIGGAGLSAIATVLLQMGLTVSGSDRQAGPGTDRLAALGATLFFEQVAANLTAISVANGAVGPDIVGPDVVLISSAIGSDNPERMAAESMGLPVVKRSEFLPALLAGRELLAVAGTHGKSTTTSMIVKILRDSGIDAGYIIGAHLPGYGNAAAGTSPYFVIEADEYDHMFLGLNPKVAVITNVEWDHPDCYPTPGSFRRAFMQFVDAVDRRGHDRLLCRRRRCRAGASLPGYPRGQVDHLWRQGRGRSAGHVGGGAGRQRRFGQPDLVECAAGTAQVAGAWPAQYSECHGRAAGGRLVRCVHGRGP